LWTEELGFIFIAHRSWSWLNLALSVFTVIKFKQLFERNSLLYKAALALISLIFTQAFTGVVLANLGFPAQFQSIHLTLGSLTVGLQLFIAILVFTKVELKKENV
jgi:cytochrome c oxidase assembly protein subunit 15